MEQQLVRAFFAGRIGYYVDVGANDQVLDSQSLHLEQLGWTGLLIEPDPDCCDLLAKARKGTVVQMACSSPANAGKQLLLNRAGPIRRWKTNPLRLVPWFARQLQCPVKHWIIFLQVTTPLPVLICCPWTLRAMSW